MSLNEPYASWFRAVTGHAAPEEPHATCARCPMVAARDFLPGLKCCTYAPAIPNFQAARVLASGGEGARRVRARLGAGHATPRFLPPTEAEAEAYDAHHRRFGTRSDMRCPYASGAGTCTIWAHRNAVCATWFCRHDRGAAGEALWDAATDLFVFAEAGVATWSAESPDAEGYARSAVRAATLSWDDVRGLGGRELRVREDRLRAAHAQWLTAR